MNQVSHQKAAPRKTALVLSAGGMFGAYQAGAYKAIAQRFPIDMVVGASVGALNGWTIAGGCSPDALIERWLHPSAGNALKLFPNAGWRNGWFDPEPLRIQAEEIHAQYTPRIPFGLVVVELPWLSTRLVQTPSVRPEHLRATCSIPLFLPTVAIDGSRYLDGGLFEKLPIWAAVEMGATRVIAVDSLPPIGPAWLRTGINIARLFKKRYKHSADLDVTVIAGSEAMGTANDAVFWNAGNSARWVDMGERDAVRSLARTARLVA